MITRTVLGDGLRVVTEQMPGVRSVSVGVWVGVGSRDETKTVAGASHFLEHLLFKGTASRTALEIATSMDAVGGDFNAFTEKEHTCYYATVLDTELAMAVEMICDVVLNAELAPADVDVERAVVLEEIAMRDDDPSDLVHDEFAQALLGDTPLGRPILGTEESIMGLSRPKVYGYYTRRYAAAEMVVSVAGNIRHDDVLRLVEKAFAGRRAEPRSTRRIAAKSTAIAQATHVVSSDTEQANIVLGCLGLAREDDRRFVLEVLSTALGGGVSSRLFQQVREQRGLAYSTYSFTSAYSGAGMFGLYAGCQPAKAEEVLSILRQLLDTVGTAGLTQAEVDRAKGQLRGSLVLGLEDSGSRMSRIGKAELNFGDVLNLDQLLSRIDAVTAEQVNALATDVAHRPRCLTVLGPFDGADFS